MRVFLAVLLCLTSFPAEAADPLVELLVTHSVQPEALTDSAAASAHEAEGEPEASELDLDRLANLRAGLSMMAAP